MIVRFWPPTRTTTSRPIFFSPMSAFSTNGIGRRRTAVPLSVISSCARSSWSSAPSAVQWAATLGGAGTSAGVGKLKSELEPLIDEFVDALFALETANRDHPEDGDVLTEAKYVQTTVLPAMQAVRDVADRLERIVPDDLWPLPKYSEILFIK